MQITQTVVYLLVGVIGLVAVSFVVQAIALIIVARNVKSMKERVDVLAPQAEEALKGANETLQDSRQQINDISGKANDILDSTKAQIKRTDDFLTEATERARVQLDRVELVLDDSITRVHETVMLLNKGVVRPVQQVSGLIAGVRTALNFFLRGGRPDVSRATTDEEMFI